MSTLSERLEKTLTATRHIISGIRTGRAHPELLNKIYVSYYGSTVPLQQVASVSVPEPTMLQLNVFDKSAVQEVEKAIQKSDLGLNPNVDGTVIRLRLPELTEDRRKDLVKIVKKTVEDGKVALRNIRRDVIDEIKAQEKAGDFSEDESKREQERVQKEVESHSVQLDKIAHDKEKEIMTV